MCKNAAPTVAALMAAIEPTLVNLLTVLGIATTPNGQAAIQAYNAALLAVQDWKPGTSAQDVIGVISAFTQVFDALPIPADAAMLANIISAGIVVVIGVLTGNSPAPGQPEGTANPNALKAMDDTATKVQKLVPDWKESTWDKARAALGDHMIAAGEYKKQWNKAAVAATKANPKYATLKV
jgi:hypothetical protein